MNKFIFFVHRIHNDDPLEHEADSIASKVANGQNADLTGVQRFFSGVQRKEKEEEAPLDLVDSLDSASGGQSMDETTRTEMESRMGTDFSGVKIHTGSEADTYNQQVNAKAFTYGQDIYFRNGQYNTHSKAGKELLAHELVHTVQQSGEVQRKVQRSPMYKQGSDLQSIWFKGIPELEDAFDGKSTFTIGTEGDHVKRIQQTLQELQWMMSWKNEAGNNFAVDLGSSGDDGIFGEHTLHSLKAAQKNLAIAETGVVDRTTMQKLDSIFWSIKKMPRSETDIKQREAAAKEKAIHAGTTETAAQRYNRLLYEYEEIIEKYGIQDIIRNYSLVDLGIVEHLLKQIKPKILLDIYEETEIIVGAKRYDAWYGSARLVILDAESVDKDHPHEVALNVWTRGGELKFMTYRNAEADAAFSAFKTKNASTAVAPIGTGITGEIGTIKVAAETFHHHDTNVAKSRQVKTNAEGHVIWNLPLLDTAYLVREGVDPSALRFVYEDRNEFVEGPSTGGCRYLTYYHEAYIGVIDVQLSTYSQFHRTDDTYFRLAYTDPNSLAWKENEAHKLFRISFGQGSRWGDPDLIRIIGEHGFANHPGSMTSTEEVAAFSYGAEGIPGTVGVEKIQTIPRSPVRASGRPLAIEKFGMNEHLGPQTEPKLQSEPKPQPEAKTQGETKPKVEGNSQLKNTGEASEAPVMKGMGTGESKMFKGNKTIGWYQNEPTGEYLILVIPDPAKPGSTLRVELVRDPVSKKWMDNPNRKILTPEDAAYKYITPELEASILKAKTNQPIGKRTPVLFTPIEIKLTKMPMDAEGKTMFIDSNSGTELGYYQLAKDEIGDYLKYEINLEPSMQKAGIGEEIFKNGIAEHNPPRIKATWVKKDIYQSTTTTGESVNLTKFNEARKTMPDNEAVFETPTGQWCRKYEYDGEPEVTEIKDGFSVNFYKK